MTDSGPCFRYSDQREEGDEEDGEDEDEEERGGLRMEMRSGERGEEGEEARRA